MCFKFTFAEDVFITIIRTNFEMFTCIKQCLSSFRDANASVCLG